MSHPLHQCDFEPMHDKQCILRIVHVARELPSQEVGSENPRKNVKGCPEVGAPPTFKAPARYETIHLQNRTATAKAHQIYKNPLRQHHSSHTHYSTFSYLNNDRLYRRIRLAGPP
jgi:hypothetical protein